MSSSASPHPPKPVSAQKETDSDLASASRRGAIPSSDNQPTVISNRPPIPTSHGNSDDTTRHLKTIRPGTRLGDIELTEHIGGGGMGQVYRGEDKRLGRAVAVKVLSRDQSSDQEAVRRFLNEAKSAARLNHQNIAQVYSAGESEEHPYIVFEYIQGVNLRTMLEEQGPLMLEEALSYTLQIADALAHAADRRIVHRDVKPSNVLIAPNGQAKLIDLGLARLSEPGNADGDLTASGVTLGTFDYISPEQARDPRNADSRSDIYSLGCTLFYMLAGRPPFPEGTVLQKLLQHQGDTPPDVCHFRPDLPEEVSHVLSKMMAKDPRRRYPDSARLMEALLTLADMIGLRPTGPAQAIWLPPQESRISAVHRQTPWLAPTLTLACLILGLHLLWSNQETSGNTRNLSKPSSQVAATRILPESEPTPAPTPDQVPGKEDSSSNGEKPSGQPQEKPESGEWTSDRLMRTSTTPLVPFSSNTQANSTTKPGRGLPRPSLVASYSPAPHAAGISPPILQSSISGDAPAPAPPAAAQTTPAPASTIPLIITHSPQDDSQYHSIGAAIAANPEADLIELRYDGRGVEEPITITGHRLTIRRGINHSPTLVFEPSATDPVLYPRDMIHVGDGGLVLEGLTVELSIRRDMPSDSWALLRLSTGGHAAFRDCTLRVRNASDSNGTYYQDVAFFRVTPQGPRSATFLNTARPERQPEIELLNCDAFGEASLVRTAESTPLRMKWIHGHLATTEPAFSIGGSSRKPASDTKTEIVWEDVVAVTDGALISITLAPQREHLAPLNFTDTSCVFSSVPLVLANVISEADELLSQFTWNSASSRRPDSSPPLSIINRSGVAIQDDVAMKNWLKDSTLPETSPRLTRQPGTPAGPMHSMTPSNFNLNLNETVLPIETAPSPSLPPDQIQGQPTTEPPTSD